MTVPTRSPLYNELQQKKIPLIFFQDITGFMVGTESTAASLRMEPDGKFCYNSVVPKITFIIGNLWSRQLCHVR